MLNRIWSGEEIENILVSIIKSIHKNGPIDSRDFELLSHIKLLYNDIFVKYEKRLLYSMGLFYKVTEPNGVLEEIYNVYAETIEESIGIKFTPVQAEAYKYIESKHYFSFSAPTSAGKSYLFRELIKKTVGDIVIVVPSRALIAEYMSLVLNLVDKSVLVLQFIENVNTDNTERRIYIITPERGVDLFNIIDDLNIELFLLDEAQITDEPIRGLSFDSLVRRIDRELPDTRKVFAHPFISNPDAQLRKHDFFSNSKSAIYRQHTVGKVFVEYNNQFSFFSPYESEWGEQQRNLEYDLLEQVLATRGTVLIYISKKKIIEGDYLTLFKKYIDLCPEIEDAYASKLIKELKEYIGADEHDKYSNMIHMMEKGIVIHHGSIPLKARLVIEDFVRAGYARLCFATSTLNQGINMPFDVVWIYTFHNMPSLTLKNLIGRAGRSTSIENQFEFGYVIVNSRNVRTFTNRINEQVSLNDTSLLDVDLEDVHEDEKDIVEAMQDYSFDDNYKLTSSQLERINNDDVDREIQNVLDLLMHEGHPINAKQYYDLGGKRSKLKSSLKMIYTKHLRKDSLSAGEQSILSAAIPILLWHIQGKSFSEVVSLRYAYLSKNDERRALKQLYERGEISEAEFKIRTREIVPVYSCKVGQIPNSNARKVNLLQGVKSVKDIDYDTIVYDTYDFMDKVISLSLTNPLYAAFSLYFDKTGNEDAMALANYIKYGTNNDTEIWLLRYGFSFEDIDWMIDYVEYVDSRKIVFKDNTEELSEERKEIIKRFI
ncbi:Helicase conserved C-terminal domain-containing protein [Dethiosulfatibacter aminovorans DSM 17477]|uniref:Helicase conserved C-terminal domain-containing protein n=1 Tax=Dethiosulfatibacter aminovorans DSM 17477 TaxID=1121476 RepID=A0A1M6M9K2_9FIRM|nr:DEAD/DEAH box helicase [Dethiosulfatibacter aminovorans]SHJ80142.1 Helicase conserved C-terminal domain-containing protein [Dethiosulfatibacter aminovorans DSM 17477]